MLQGPGIVYEYFLVADQCCIKHYALPIKTWVYEWIKRLGLFSHTYTIIWLCAKTGSLISSYEETLKYDVSSKAGHTIPPAAARCRHCLHPRDCDLHLNQDNVCFSYNIYVLLNKNGISVVMQKDIF